ncbi:MAG: DUF4199 domain-containing protein [Cytophagales bacterium]|uniref:DUF4199 domain-containing protein n=1 Tax=Cyclobacterium marinum TaxID=104 RepID=UPI0030D9C047|nr:DUF4199 domain-containing protein [Cytophagales bacterium]|tara:strand:+ start:44461 stop:45012 length:552 start_codon:yes stop_codon:yes gene_type:complete
MELQENISPSKAALNFGLIIGLVMVTLTFIIYFINYTFLVAAWYGFAVFALFFGMVIYFGIQYRKDIGGFMTFGTAFQFAFVTLIVSGLITTFGNILLYQVINPELSEILVKVQLENMMDLLDNFGASDSLSSEQIKDMRVDMEDAFTIGGQVSSFGISLFIYAILSLILGAIIKKRDKSTDF